MSSFGVQITGGSKPACLHARPGFGEHERRYHEIESVRRNAPPFASNLLIGGDHGILRLNDGNGSDTPDGMDNVLYLIGTPTPIVTECVVVTRSLLCAFAVDIRCGKGRVSWGAHVLGKRLRWPHCDVQPPKLQFSLLRRGLG